MPGISPNGVSRYLRNRGFIRASGPLGGYTVTNSHLKDQVCVLYRPGAREADMTPEYRRRIVETALQRMRRALEKRYTVTVVEVATGMSPFMLRVQQRRNDERSGQ